MNYYEDLLKAYRTIQLSGRVNMLLMDAVRELAEAYRLNDLVEFIDDFGKDEYIKMQEKVAWPGIQPYDNVLHQMR